MVFLYSRWYFFYPSFVFVWDGPCQSCSDGLSKFLVLGEVWSATFLLPDWWWILINNLLESNNQRIIIPASFFLYQAAADRIITFYLTISELTNHSGIFWLIIYILELERRRSESDIECFCAANQPAPPTAEGGRRGDKECRNSL